jgi:ParB family chromosome partitioning protein
VIEVELGRIEPNPRQPRRQVEDEHLPDLADSIRAHGLLQPLVVTRLDAGDSAAAEATGAAAAAAGLARAPRYQLIAGERRWAAAKLAGLVRVPVVVREATSRQLLELALVENVQRADLNPLEEAAAYQQLAEEFGLTQEEIGRRVGKSRFAVSNTLRLLQLPAALQQDVLAGRLSEGHARALLGLSEQEVQRRLAQQVTEEGLSVRQTEELVRRAEQAHQAHLAQQTQSAATQTLRRKPARSADVLELEERFRTALGTKVSLTRSRRGGRLTIHYYDDDQLQEIYERLAGGA